MRSCAWRLTEKLRTSGALLTPTARRRTVFGRPQGVMSRWMDVTLCSLQIGKINWARVQRTSFTEQMCSSSNYANRLSRLGKYRYELGAQEPRYQPRLSLQCGLAISRRHSRSSNDI